MRMHRKTPGFMYRGVMVIIRFNPKSVTTIFVAIVLVLIVAEITWMSRLRVFDHDVDGTRSFRIRLKVNQSACALSIEADKPETMNRNEYPDWVTTRKPNPSHGSERLRNLNASRTPDLPRQPDLSRKPNSPNGSNPPREPNQPRKPISFREANPSNGSNTHRVPQEAVNQMMKDTKKNFTKDASTEQGHIKIIKSPEVISQNDTSKAGHPRSVDKNEDHLKEDEKDKTKDEKLKEVILKEVSLKTDNQTGIDTKLGRSYVNHPPDEDHQNYTQDEHSKVDKTISKEIHNRDTNNVEVKIRKTNNTGIAEQQIDNKDATVKLNSSTTNLTRGATVIMKSHKMSNSSKSSNNGEINHQEKFSIAKVAIGAGITSRNIRNFNPGGIRKLPMFSLLSSFCKTGSLGYEYHFYFGYDRDDVIGNATYLKAIDDAFDDVIQRCNGLNVGALRMVKCDHNGKPAWAQNDAMMQAYLENMEYFYRVNDDTILLTTNWTERYISALKRLEPPLIGVIGPRVTRHRRATGPGDKAVITHDFVHRTHIEIFGFYYPRPFRTWFADNWISYVYAPERIVQLSGVLVNNSETLGMRYKVDNMNMLEESKKLAVVHKQILHRYLNYTLSPWPHAHPGHGTNVISMSLYGRDPRYMYGAIRNAQLLHIVYPGWILRVYHHPKSTSSNNSELFVPSSVLKTLVRLGVQLFPITDEIMVQQPSLWRLLVIDDAKIAYFLVRNADGRIGNAEAEKVLSWMNSGNSQGLHYFCQECQNDTQKLITIDVENATESESNDTKSYITGEDGGNRRRKLLAVAKRKIKKKKQNHRKGKTGNNDSVAEKNKHSRAKSSIIANVAQDLPCPSPTRISTSHNPLSDGRWGGHVISITHALGLSFTSLVYIAYDQNENYTSADTLDELWAVLRPIARPLSKTETFYRRYTAFDDGVRVSNGRQNCTVYNDSV